MILTGNLEISGVDSSDYSIPSGKCLVVKGILNGNITVCGNGVFELKGIMNGNLEIAQCGHATIRGILNSGTIINYGKLDVFGIVEAEFFPDNATIHSGAIVNGQKY